MNMLQYLAIPIGYLLGSIPASFIIGKLIGKVDMRSEGDGKISASAVYRRLGPLPFLLVVAIDAGKGILSIYLAELMSNGSWVIVMLSGFAAVVGHNWSMFLRFKGGLGATVTWGVLAAIAFPQFLIAAIPGFFFGLVTKKSGTATGLIIVLLTIIFTIQKILFTQALIAWDIPYYVIPYPLLIIIFMVLKRYQIRKMTSEKIDFSDS